MANWSRSVSSSDDLYYANLVISRVKGNCKMAIATMIILTMFVDFFLYNFIVFIAKSIWHPVYGMRDSDGSRLIPYCLYGFIIIITVVFNFLMTRAITENF